MYRICNGCGDSSEDVPFTTQEKTRNNGETYIYMLRNCTSCVNKRHKEYRNKNIGSDPIPVADRIRDYFKEK